MFEQIISALCQKQMSSVKTDFVIYMNRDSFYRLATEMEYAMQARPDRGELTKCDGAIHGYPVFKVTCSEHPDFRIVEVS